MAAAFTIDKIRAEARDTRLGSARDVAAGQAGAAGAGLAATSTIDKIGADARDASWARDTRCCCPGKGADAHDAGLVAASTIDQIVAEARDA